MENIVRPCFIVIDPEHSGSISTRKLVIETAKLNVITAYSGAEALATLRKYPAVDGIVCNTQVHDIPVGEVIREARKINKKVPVVVIGPYDGNIQQADNYVDSFDPKQLLKVLQTLQPEKVSAIAEHDDELREAESSESPEVSRPK
jgi:CheY-like chemotaxis protein